MDMEGEVSRSMQIRGWLRTAELAVLFIGAFVDILIVFLDKDINPLIAILISAAIVGLCLVSGSRGVEYFMRRIQEVTQKDLVFYFVKLVAVIVLVYCSVTLQETLLNHIWITSALVIFLALQSVGLLIGYFYKK